MIRIGWCRNAESLGGAEAATVEEHGKVDDVSHVVMAIDVGVTQHTVEVLVYGLDDDMRVTSKDGDEGAFREEHSNLQTEETRE